MHKRWLMTLGVGLWAVMMTGCGDDTDETNAGGTDSTDVAVSNDATADATEGSDTTDDSSDAGPMDPLSQAGFPLTVADDGSLSLGPLAGASGSGGVYANTIATRSTEEEVRFLLGFYTFAEGEEAWTTHAVSGTLDALDAGNATVTVEAVGDGTVALNVTAPAGHNRTSIAFRCHEDDRFFGFGGQTPRLEHRGHRVPIWIQEQGLGKSEEKLEADFDLTFTGAPYDQYYGVPFFLSPRGYGVLVDQPQRTVFHLCSENSGFWRVETWSSSLRLVLFNGPEPTTVLERATNYWGRPPAVVDWALLPWIAIKGGSAIVREKVEAMIDAGIAASAIWSEDWLGESINPITGFNIKYHWEWDPEQYPDLPKLIEELHADDIKFLGYFNPFVVTKFSEWTEATENGWLPKTPDGEDYQFAVLAQEGSVVDLTSADARQWLLDHLNAARDLGIDGWMADYAEWVPWDAQFADGRTGADVSSDYPRIWQDVNRQACDPSECVFFVRSGYTGSNALAPVAWGGDQNTDFGEDDGLPTAVRIGVGLGLTGVAMYGADIAGYTSFNIPPSSKELYFRWTEAGAFQPVMRTHEGNAGEAANWQWDRDEETIAHFKHYTELHTRLFPFYKALLHEATQTGLPIMRHPMLHYPQAERMWAVSAEYLLGQELYVAPVVAQGATTRTLSLPPGEWVEWETGTRHSGDSEITVDAPLEAIPVFARAGAIVPMLPTTVHRTTEAQTLHESHLLARVYAGADGSFTLADGTTLQLTSSATTDPGDAGLPACTGEERDCQVLDGNSRTYRLGNGTLDTDSLSFTASGSRQWDIQVFFAP